MTHYIGFYKELGYPIEQGSIRDAARSHPAPQVATLLNYLLHGTPVALAAPSLDPATVPTRGIYTDGTWCWPAELPALIRERNLVVPGDLWDVVLAQPFPSDVDIPHVSRLHDEVVRLAEKPTDLAQSLSQHTLWVLSNGVLGERFVAGDMHLFEADLNWTQLAHADLSHGSLGHATLREAHLRGADLSHATLTHANFTRGDLGCATLDGAICTQATFAQANLYRASLVGTNCQGTNFCDADLRRSSIWASCCDDALFDEALVHHTHFHEVSLIGARFPLVHGLDLAGFDSVTFTPGDSLSHHAARARARTS